MTIERISIYIPRTPPQSHHLQSLRGTHALLRYHRTKTRSLVDVAQQAPVFIERDQWEVAVLVSAREYARLSSAANQDFQDFCDSVSHKAAAQGLTESKLNELLTH